MIRENEIRIWRIGHATLLINFCGTTILTDPVFVNWIPYPRRIVGLPYSISDLPHIDVILISHAHLEHLNRSSLRRLVQKTSTIILTENCSGFKKIVETTWNNIYKEESLSFSAIKPQHWGKRMPWETIKRGYNAYVMEKNGRSIYFGGDSGYAPFFKQIGERYKINVAILGIGAYCPDSFLKSHKSPEQAVDAMIDLKARHMIPMHYGDFRISLEPMSEPPERLAKAAQQKGVRKKIHILDNGESWAL